MTREISTTLRELGSVRRAGRKKYEIRVEIRQFEGSRYVDVAGFYEARSQPGRWLRGGRGIGLRVEELPGIIEALKLGLDALVSEEPKP